MKQPRIAEMVATTLRDQILVGELREGDELPRQDILLEQFAVSAPSMREALRILESQGLITVRRGNQGGAVVHAPREQNAADVIGLVLRFRDVAYADVGAALKVIEPACTGLIAVRKDRRRKALPRLRGIHEHGKRVIDDFEEFTRLSRDFHEAIVAECGNETLILMVGALETIYREQWENWAVDTTSEGRSPDNDVRQAGIRAHERIIAAIEKGDREAAELASRRHLEVSHLHTLDDVFGRRGMTHDRGRLGREELPVANTRARTTTIERGGDGT